MSTAKYRVLVTTEVEVWIDPDKFDADFMREYQESFTPISTIEGHARNLAWLEATGRNSLEGPHSNDFIEGYGPQQEMGIRAKVLFSETEVSSP